MEAISIIKTNKATSLDCTTDYIIKVLTQKQSNDHSELNVSI